MTIEKHRQWGSPSPLPADAPVASSDAELAALVARGIGPIGILGGDLCRTVGGNGNRDRLRSGEAVSLPCDVLQVELDSQASIAVAHVVLRRSWWRGPLVAVMNAQFIGEWNVAPRSHPNDGLMDVLSADAMSFDQRLKAKRRLPSGVHVPHPNIAQSRTATWERRFERPIGVWLDGVAHGRATQVSITVRPDAMTIVV
ncbi:MAG: diacylglycerol kinase family protein [Acidimicrobiia bacterium]